MAYTKLFNSIVTSSIWGESNSTRIVWITLLALADKNGEVQASIPGLARVACVSIEECEAAITAFLSPDVYSRTKDDEGRRAEVIDGGWHLINHEKYRKMASREDEQAKNAERQARFRQNKARNEKVTGSNDLVTTSNGGVTPDVYIAEAEAEAEEEKEDYAISEKSSEKEKIKEVFDYWKEALSHSSTKLTPDRVTKIRARLKEGYTPGQLKQAIDGCRASPFHMGDNDTKTKHDGIDLIFRNSAKTDYFIEFAPGPKTNSPAPEDDLALANRMEQAAYWAQFGPEGTLAKARAEKEKI